LTTRQSVKRNETVATKKTEKIKNATNAVAPQTADDMKVNKFKYYKTLTTDCYTGAQNKQRLLKARLVALHHLKTTPENDALPSLQGYNQNKTSSPRVDLVLFPFIYLQVLTEMTPFQQTFRGTSQKTAQIHQGKASS
jgi:hypothetical protein